MRAVTSEREDDRILTIPVVSIREERQTREIIIIAVPFICNKVFNKMLNCVPIDTFCIIPPIDAPANKIRLVALKLKGIEMAINAMIRA